MKTIITATFLVIFFVGTPQVKAQLPGIGDLVNRVDQAASQLSDQSDSILGFKKLQMPKLLDGLVDVRLKKPTIPSLGLLDKIKTFGQPANTTANAHPIMSSLGKLFQPPETNNNQGFLQKLLGTPAATETPNFSSLLNNSGISNLSNATQQFQQQAGNVSQDVRSAATQLFGNQNLNSALQPPLRAARQHSQQILSR